jgi:acyl carrier protein
LVLHQCFTGKQDSQGMDQSAKITSTIADCIAQLNKQLAVGNRLATSPDTILIGDGGSLDSLGLITLFVSIEQELASKHGLSCPLLDTVTSDENTDSMDTIAKLAQWINENAAIA